MKNPINRISDIKTRTLIAALAILAVASCKNGGQTFQEPVYPVMTVSTDSITIDEYYSASIRGRQDIDIYPQISGKIVSLNVKEGQKVRRGELLFLIDQIPYQAALRTAKANVNAAEAQVRTAELEYRSKTALFNEKVVSEYDMLTAENALAAAKAALEQAKAQQVNAENDLSYTEVRSPSDGTVGTLPFRVGALVGASMAQALTTVSDNENMYVYFSMTENQLRALLRQYGSPEETIRRMPAVRLQLNDGSIYEQEGRVETISGVINPKTGTVSVRSVFPNADRLLFSGGIGNVVVPHSEQDAIIIPQNATFELQDRLVAYKVVDGKTVAVTVKADKLHDGKRFIVRSGLSAGDVIVTEGTGLLREGMAISTRPEDEENNEK